MDNKQFPRWLIFCLAVSVCIGFAFNFVLGRGGLVQENSSTSPTETQTEDAPSGLFYMERVGYDSNFEFYRDPVTDVLYLCLSGYSETGVITMQDPETGLPLTYSRYMELYNQLSPNSQ